MKVSALVPAAGKGSRLRKDVKASRPKPFLSIGGVPVLARTLCELQAVPFIEEIVVASEKRYHAAIEVLARQYGVKKFKKVVVGGVTRTASVQAALLASNPSVPFALVHDGVRPLVSAKSITRFIQEFQKKKSKAAVIGRPVIPTIKVVERSHVVSTPDRSGLWEIGTPQMFEKKLLRKAYAHHKRKRFKATDDSSLVEAMGETVHVIASSEPNIKITTVEDLKFAAAFFGSTPALVGLGEDCHRLVKGRPLYLGGLKIPSPKGAKGHSDGDVILHAIIDAILGAIGAGDIGDFFSDKDPRWKGIRSAKMLAVVLEKMTAVGYGVQNVDVTVTLEHPKLGLWKPKIQSKVAGLLGLEPRRVGMKAKTAEGLGPEGAGEALRAKAIATLRRSENWSE